MRGGREGWRGVWRCGARTSGFNTFTFRFKTTEFLKWRKVYAQMHEPNDSDHVRILHIDFVFCADRPFFKSSMMHAVHNAGLHFPTVKLRTVSRVDV